MAVVKPASYQEEEPLPTVSLLLDARKLLHGGIGAYTRNLISGLLETGTVEITLIGALDEIERFPWSSKVEVIEDKTPPYSFDEYILLPRRLNYTKYHLFHSPHYTLPFGLKIPTVITIHDLIHIYHPQRAYYPLVAGRLIRSALKRASKVLTVSEAVRRDLERFTKNDQRILSKIAVIPNALDPYFLETPLEPDYLTSRLRINVPYFLSVVSQLKPHKGLDALLTSYALLKKTLLETGESYTMPAGLGDVKLVVVGHGTEKLVEEPELLQKIGELRGIQILGGVSQEDLLHLYAGAQALVIPSVTEGFCLPVIEAQALGTPIITRPVPAVCEILTPRDLPASDFSESALCSAMLKSLRLSEENQRARTEFTCVEHLKRFDRRRLAKQVLDIYRKAIKE